jgi:hypothetical protein
MSARELLFLTPYRLPTQNTLYLADDDVATFLNGLAALWHPAALAGASGPPRLASPYDHEQPAAGHVYAVPETPPLFLPEDWDWRVREAGAVAFRATPDRAATLANLRDALHGFGANLPESAALLDLDPGRAGPFHGVGLGLAHVEALYEAMSHDSLLSVPDLWKEVQEAVTALAGPDADAPRRALQAAAERLLAAREVLYPVTIHVVDLCLPEEGRLEAAWPAALAGGLPVNVLAPAALLGRLGHEQPARLAELRERLAADLADVCGGPYREREDALLPLESQLWNLVKGQAAYQELLGREVRVFARRRFGFHPQLPMLLQSAGISRAVLHAFDESVVPAPRSPVVSWASPDGKQVEAFARAPYPADSPSTFFHLTHYLHRTIMQDGSATLALLHRGKPDDPCYADWVELTRLAPVLGRWTTLSAYLDAVMAGEYLGAPSADEFHGDYLVERCPAEATGGEAPRPADEGGGEPPAPATKSSSGEPVSWFARQVRARRRLDTAWALAALYAGLGRGPVGGEPIEDVLARLEDRLEGGDDLPADELTAAEDGAAEALARRLVAHGPPGQPGYLVLNPCGFRRRVGLELRDAAGAPPLGGAVKACQFGEGTARVVVEVPALGFAWFARPGAPAAAPAGRMRLADARAVRNEFFEAEIDPATGGLRSVRDHRTRVPRVGQQLVFNPGSTMRARDVRVSSTGPALGEVVSEGDLLDAHGRVLATFRQRFRAWAGRPVLELRVEIFPAEPPRGYPWHAYYAARFAWRDERATLLRGVNGSATPTGHTRPETPDFLEVRLGSQNTLVFPGGLPFHQRHGGRMLDVLLVPPGEGATAFDLGIGLDRDYPAQTALGMATPAPLVPTDRGPPHVGAAGWLFHLDAPDLLLTTLRPAPGGADAVLARLLECGGSGGAAELRCARDPRRAALLDARGNHLLELPTRGDAVLLDVNRHDLTTVRVEFS